MVVNIKWFPRLEKKGEKMKKKGGEMDQFGEEMEEKYGREMKQFGEEMEKKGEKMEKTSGDRDLGTVAESIINDLEYVKLGNLCKKLGVDPVQILRRAYLEEVAKIEDIEQRNLSMLSCLDKEQQEEVSAELISILKSKLQ